MVFYEGYPSAVNPPAEVIRRSESILAGIYERGEIPDAMRSPRFVLVMPIEKSAPITKRYAVYPSFSNESWAVFTFQ